MFCSFSWMAFSSPFCSVSRARMPCGAGSHQTTLDTTLAPPSPAQHPQELETCSGQHIQVIQLQLQMLKEKYKDAEVVPLGRRSKLKVGEITGRSNQHLCANDRSDVGAPVLHQFTGLWLTLGCMAVPGKIVSQRKANSFKRIFLPGA